MGPLIVFAASLIGAASQGASSGPVFTQPPRVTKAADGSVQIAFAVDREIDVAVFIEDGAGKVVRHLVAGVLGKNPPAPLKPDSLTQTIGWDGKDDDGRPAAHGPFRVKVSLGLRPTLDSYLLSNPAALGMAENLAVDRNGNLYHSTNPGGVYYWNAPGMLTRVYDRQGRYLRTIMPYPADLPAERLTGAGVFQADGRTYPVWHDVTEMRLYPGRETYGHEMFVTSAGRLCKLVSAGGSGVNQWALRAIMTDGATPADAPVLGPVFTEPMSAPNACIRHWVCAGSDEKQAYLAGLARRGAGDNAVKYLHAVYRAPLDGSAQGGIFLGSGDQSGNDEKHFDRPKGVCADGKGLLYVADFGNHRIQVFKEADGAFVGSVPVKGPTTVQVHPKTGAIYVLSADKFSMSLVKISGQEKPVEVGRLALLPAYDETFAVMVLDAGAEPPVLYASGRGPRGKYLLRLVDRGTTFESADLMTKGAPSAGNAEDLLVDRLRDELYVKTDNNVFVRVDLKTGKTTALKYPGFGGACGTQLGLSPDGETIYSFGYMEERLRKFDRDFKPVKFAALDSPVLDVRPLMSFASRGFAVAPNGDLYLVPGIIGGQGERLSNWGKMSQVAVYKPDGTRKGTAVWRCTDSLTGPRFDRQGNLYVVDCVTAPGRIIPEWFDGKIPPLDPKTASRKPSSSPARSVSWMYGSIIKFPPSGGAIWCFPEIMPGKGGWGEDVPAEILARPTLKAGGVRGAKAVEIGIQGAFWYHYGASPFAHKSLAPVGDCNCQSARFDVDDFGRVFFPDVGRFRVGVLDTNGNDITDFGRYGNRDCAGRGSPIPQPELAFAYPYTVALSRTHAFVGDVLNNRIAKVRLAYSAETTCEVK